MNLNPWSVLLGAIITGILSYRAVPWLVEFVDARVQESVSHTNETVGPRLPGGEILGNLECAIFFASFLWTSGLVLASAWLVFKTAAKWKTWQSVGDVPRAETQARYRVFVIGTAANIVAALFGAVIAQIP